MSDNTPPPRRLPTREESINKWTDSVIAVFATRPPEEQSNAIKAILGWCGNDFVQIEREREKANR